MAQLEFHWDDASMRAHALERGITGISLDILSGALILGDLRWIDDQQCSVLRHSQRSLAEILRASKSGVQKALLWLSDRGIVSKGDGVVAVWWDRVRDMEPVATDGFIPLLAASGHRAVSPCIYKEQEQIPTNTHNTTQTAKSEPDPTSAPVVARSSLGYTLKWDDLRRDGRLNPAGITRFYSAAVANGWIEHTGNESFAEIVALVALVVDEDRRKAAGVTKPINWLIGVVRAGRHAWAWRLKAEDVDEIAQRIQRQEVACG